MKMILNFKNYALKQFCSFALVGVHLASCSQAGNETSKSKTNLEKKVENLNDAAKVDLQSIAPFLPVVRLIVKSKTGAIEKTCAGVMVGVQNKIFEAKIFSAHHCVSSIVDFKSQLEIELLNSKLVNVLKEPLKISELLVQKQPSFSDANSSSGAVSGLSTTPADFSVLKVVFSGSPKLNLKTENIFSTVMQLPKNTDPEKYFAISTIPNNVGAWPVSGFFPNGNHWGYYGKNAVGLSGSPVVQCKSEVLETCDFTKIYAVHIESSSSKMKGIPGFAANAWANIED